MYYYSLSTWTSRRFEEATRKYFGILRRWRTRILEREKPAPVWLGIPYGHSISRTMNEDRFTETMREFYQTYQGKRASTEDFRRVAERHLGADLGWFFD